jgi:hypothetical protein
MRQLVLSVVMGLGLAVTAAGCGSDGGGGGGGTVAATTASCNAYCTAYIAKACTDPMYTSAAECMTEDCGVIAGVPDRCQGKLQAYYDCRKGQADLCGDTACGSELTTAGLCM